MSIETLGLAISLISLTLGLVSAWQQIKALILRAVRFGGDAAKSWAQREQSLIQMYLDRPSVLVAYLGKSGVSIFLLFIALLFIRPDGLQHTFGFPPSVAKTLFLAPACLIGLVLGAISSRCADVIRLASKRTGTGD